MFHCNNVLHWNDIAILSKLWIISSVHLNLRYYYQSTNMNKNLAASMLINHFGSNTSMISVVLYFIHVISKSCQFPQMVNKWSFYTFQLMYCFVFYKSADQTIDKVWFNIMFRTFTYTWKNILNYMVHLYMAIN